MTIADDPQTLAGLVTALGGTVLPGKTFKFDLPLSKVREIIPKLNSLTGLRVEKVAERQDTGDPRGIDRVQGIATLELKRQPEPTSYDAERTLMSAIIR